MWYAPLLGSRDKEARNKKRLAEELDSLREMGVNTVSILAGTRFTSTPSDSANLTKGTLTCFTTDEHILCGLDYVLGELAQRRMKAIVVLTHCWNDALTSEWEIERFAKKLALRTNPFTHHKLLSDPTVSFWQISDASGSKQQTDVDAYVKWATQQAQMMKQKGFKQPVSVAYSPTSSQLDAVEQTLQEIMCRDCIDNLALSLDPLALGWLTPGELNSALGKIYLRATDVIQTSLRTALSFGKTLYLTDCAYPRAAMFTRPATNTDQRDNFLAFLFSTCTELTANSASSPFLGIVVKGWGGSVRPTDNQWTAPYDFTAEYPYDTKGRYSVFNNDISTLNLLKAAWHN